MEALRSLGIEINVSGNTAGLKNIESSIAGIKNAALGAGAAIAGAFAFGQVKNFIMGAIDFGDQFADQSMRLGLSAVQLQEWSFVAEQAGISAETVAKGISKLNQNLGEAQLGNAKASQTFAELGINIKNASGGFKDTNEIVFELADRLNKLPTVAQKTAFATKVGGKGFKELGVVLGQGGDLLREQIKLLHEVGGVLSNDAAASADQFKDKLNLINRSWQTSKTILVLQLMPMLTQVSTWFSQGIVWLRNFEKETGAVSTAIKVLGGVFFVSGIKAAAPFLILGLELFAIFAVIQDIYYFLTGKGDSFLEDFIMQTYGAEKGTQYIIAMRTAFSDLLDVLNQITSPFKTISGFIDNLRYGARSVVAFTKDMGSILTGGQGTNMAELQNAYGLEHGIANATYGSWTANFTEMGKKMPAIRSDILLPQTQVSDIVKNPNRVNAMAPMLDMQSSITQPSIPYLTNPPASNASQTNNVTNNYNISGTDPKAIAAEVQKIQERERLMSHQDFQTFKGST